MLEKGRLYSLRKDGAKESEYLDLKKKRFLFGSSEYCTVRMYIHGIFPEHCVLTIEGQGKAFLEPLHPSALTLVNSIKINHKVCLEDNDIITIFIKEFRFTYPSISLSRSVCFERLLVLPYPKQMKSAQKFKITLGNNMETSHPLKDSSVSYINYIPKKHICEIRSDIFKKIPEYLLNFKYQESVNISYEKSNAQEVKSCSDKSLIRCMNQYVKESSESRRELALKLYEFFSFLRILLNRNEEYLYDLWSIWKSAFKYCVVRASEDILFLPLKSFDFKYLHKEEKTSHEKSQQSRILPCTIKNSSSVSNVMEKKNHCISPLEVSVSSECKIDKQKQNQYSSRKISISYKKRVSLAVKRYHLRKRKSIMMSKASEIGSDENLELPGESWQMKDRCRENYSYEQDVEKQKTTRTKRKRGGKKENKELQNEKELKIEQEISVEAIKDTVGKQNITSEPTKEKRGKKKTAAKKTNLNAGKENIPELRDNFSGNQVSIPGLRKQKPSNEKRSSKNTGLKHESEKESIDYSAEEQTTEKKLAETKPTKHSYERKKKKATANKTVFKDKMETKFIHDSPMKQNNSSESNELKSKKGSNKKKKEVSLERTDLCKSSQESDTQVFSSQRITRSMAKSRY